MFIATAYAMGAPGGSAPGPGGGGASGLIMMLVIFAIFYFILIRPQQKRQKEHRSLLSNIKVGDQVLTGGGIYGRVTGLRDRRDHRVAGRAAVGREGVGSLFRPTNSPHGRRVGRKRLPTPSLVDSITESTDEVMA